MSSTTIDKCAACGKKGGDELKTCTACKLVKYCNRDCQISHRPQHKKACKKRAAEIYDEKLFEEPPSLGDCPICFLCLPSLSTGRKYMACCGKTICSGCCHAPVYENQGNVVARKTCPFCRILKPTSEEEAVDRNKKRMEANDPIAIFNIGVYYRDGTCGFPQDMDKALEHWLRAGELGYAAAYHNVGYAHSIGRGEK